MSIKSSNFDSSIEFERILDSKVVLDASARVYMFLAQRKDGLSGHFAFDIQSGEDQIRTDTWQVSVGMSYLHSLAKVSVENKPQKTWTFFSNDRKHTFLRE